MYALIELLWGGCIPIAPLAPQLHPFRPYCTLFAPLAPSFSISGSIDAQIPKATLSECGRGMQVGLWVSVKENGIVCSRSPSGSGVVPLLASLGTLYGNRIGHLLFCFLIATT